MGTGTSASCDDDKLLAFKEAIAKGSPKVKTKLNTETNTKAEAEDTIDTIHWKADADKQNSQSKIEKNEDDKSSSPFRRHAHSSHQCDWYGYNAGVKQRKGKVVNSREDIDRGYFEETCSSSSHQQQQGEQTKTTFIGVCSFARR
jgi:hypothetical protein